VSKMVNLKKDRLASASKDATIKIWNHQSGLLLETLTGHSSFIYDLTLLKADCLVSGSEDKSVKIWNVSVVYGYPNASNMNKFGKHAEY
jgi:WD40 repeat protein